MYKKTIESEENFSINDENTIINNSQHSSLNKTNQSFKNHDSGGIPKHLGDDECDFFSDND